MFFCDVLCPISKNKDGVIRITNSSPPYDSDSLGGDNGSAG